jgi:hypothetical protein
LNSKFWVTAPSQAHALPDVASKVSVSIVSRRNQSESGTKVDSCGKIL